MSNYHKLLMTLLNSLQVSQNLFILKDLGRSGHRLFFLHSHLHINHIYGELSCITYLNLFLYKTRFLPGPELMYKYLVSLQSQIVSTSLPSQFFSFPFFPCVYCLYGHIICCLNFQRNRNISMVFHSCSVFFLVAIFSLYHHTVFAYIFETLS